MILFGLFVEPYDSMRPDFFHEIGSKTMKSGMTFQPVFTSYKLQ